MNNIVIKEISNPSFFKNLVFIFALFIIGWVLFFSMYASPSVDDFCFAYWTKINGILGAVKFAYVEANGRFTASLLITAFTYFKFIFIDSYFLVPLAICFSVYFSSITFLKIFEIADLKFLAVFYVILLASFSFRQTIFWLAGGFTYSLGNCLFIIISALEFKIYLKNENFEIPKTVGIATLAFSLSGFNETIMLSHIGFLSALLIFLVLRKRSIGSILSLLLILFFALFGAAISIISPGNAIRISATPHIPQFFLAIESSFLVIIYTYWKAWLGGIAISFSALLIMRPKIKFIYLDWLIYTGSLFTALVCSVFVRQYILGDLGPPRTQSIDHILIALISFLGAMFFYTINTGIFQNISRRWLVAPTCLFFFCCLLGKPGVDGPSFYSTLINMQYAVELSQYMSLRNSKLALSNEPEVSLDNLSNKGSSSTFFDDIQGDSADWRNRCLANYFGLNRVYLIN